MWWKHAHDELMRNNTVEIRPRGHSMSGRIESGQLVTLAPFADREPTVNDIVLVRVKGSVFLHLIKAQQDDRFLIGNNKGGTNGWTSRKNIFGFVLRIDP